MFSTRWQTSPRQYGVRLQRHVRIPVSAGFQLDAHLALPDAHGRFPALVSLHPFDNDGQFESLLPQAISPLRVVYEAGDHQFYVRRGYAFLSANCRGTGRSGGCFDHLGRGMIRDFYELIEWAACQPWCNGQVGTFGTSYFAMTAKLVAELRPPSLKAVFAPFGVTDQYRQAVYHGGILSYAFHTHWLKQLSNLRVRTDWRDALPPGEWRQRIDQALDDPEIRIHPGLVAALEHPERDHNMLVAEYLINPLDTPLHRERTPRGDTDIDIAGYFGGCWGMHMLHLPGDFDSFQNPRWQGPKRLSIGPPYYLDRPVYQYQDESLRWFDQFLKGVDTGVLEEPRVQLFIQNSGEWKTAHDWPLPQTRWTEFCLHRAGLLSEHDYWPDETASTLVDTPAAPGQLEFHTPQLVEATEICGPLVLNLFASTTDTELLWFATLFQTDVAGAQRTLSRGWLRGSQRRLDPARSRPWQPWHLHQQREPLTPGQIYEFNLAIIPTGVLLTPGMRLGLRLKLTDRDARPTDFIDQHAYGHLYRPFAATVTLHHSARYPSALLVPITRGNIVGTFMSGGVMPPLDRPPP